MHRRTSSFVTPTRPVTKLEELADPLARFYFVRFARPVVRFPVPLVAGFVVLHPRE
jgi:hypothetical protein